MPDWFDRWLSSLEVLSWWEILLYTVITAFVVQYVVTWLVRLLTKRTKTTLDDDVLAALRRPLFLTVLFIGLGVMLKGLDLAPVWKPRGIALLVTLGAMVWMRALMRVGDAVLAALARRADDFKWIEPASLPLYEIGSKLLILGSTVYVIMIAWDIDLTAWLASAGILGIAIGFAAKDTLANLFAGIFILADAPYKLGDFIVLESGERGQVTDIGIRSTRILTRDDIEITVPNGVMANSKIINESSGPHVKRRLRVDIGIAYGSDVEKARAAMLAAAEGCELLSKSPAPSVRFRAFGDSALVFQVRGYIDAPVLHGRALDQLCTRLNSALADADVEIPFPQRVVHMAPSSTP